MSRAETSDTQAERVSPPKTVRCAKCAALNPRSAQWCGQCLAPMNSSQRAPEPPAAPDGRGRDEHAAERRGPPGGASTPPDGEVRGAFRVSEDRITWLCRLCDSTNPLENSFCAVCGAPLASTLRPDERGPLGDPNIAALVSLAFPGAGHAVLGLWGQAVARAVTGAWVFAVAVFSGLQQGLAPISVLFGTVSVALWAVSPHDAYREALRQRSSVILGDRSLLWVVVALVLLSIATLLTSVLART